MIDLIVGLHLSSDGEAHRIQVLSTSLPNLRQVGKISGIRQYLAIVEVHGGMIVARPATVFDSAEMELLSSLSSA
jgi:hypothetical protein